MNFDGSVVLKGFVTIQVQNFGKYSEDQINRVSESTTASAKALAVALLKKYKPEALETKEVQDVNKAGEDDSTLSYHFEISARDAYLLLGDIDSRKNTPDFDRKAEKFFSIRRLYPGSISKMPLDMKKEAMEALSKVGFTGYSYQVFVKVGESGKFASDYIQSKKHFYLQHLTISKLKENFSQFNVSWIEPPKESDGKNTQSGSSATIPETVDSKTV